MKKTTKQPQQKPSLSEWVDRAGIRTACVICRSSEALAWTRQLRQIVREKKTAAPPLEAQAERISEDVGFLVTPSDLRRHRRSCERSSRTSE